MPTATTELNLSLALDADDDADYLTISLANSLRTLDALFNNVTGHSHSGAHQGGALAGLSVTTGMLADGAVTSVKIADLTIQTVDIADGAVTAAKLAAGSLLPESLFAGTTTVQGTAYTVAATILWVFCTAAIVVTLPAAATTNRPITVVAVTGASTVAAAGGTVIGGSVNTSTGAIMNGTVSQGDSITYKSDLTNWESFVTFLASSAAALWNQVTLWQGRANQAWGASRVWSSGSSFETDSANNAASASSWQANANNAWGPSRVWNSGVSFETNANNAWGPSRVYGSGASFETNYNNEVALYNALVAALNNPDGESTTALSWPSLPVGSGDTSTITLTIPRNGHYVVGAYVDGQVAMNSFGAGVDAILTGIIAATKTSNGWSNTGSPLFHQGWVQHGDYTAGQTLSAHLHCAFINGGNASGLLYAHFVPNATYHN